MTSAAAAVALVATGVVAAALTGCTSDTDTGARTGVPPEPPGGAYTVTYRLEELGDVRHEQVAVRLPYRSRRLSTREGVVVSGTLTNPEGLWQWTGGDGGGWRRIEVGKRPAEAHPDPLGSLPLLADHDLAYPAGDAVVGGHDCRLIRTGAPIGDRAVAPTEHDHAELCVHRSGVVLREVWVLDGRTVRRREALQLTLDAALADSHFAPFPASPTASEPLPTEQSPVAVTTAMEAAFAVTLDGLPHDITDDGVVAAATHDALGTAQRVSVRRLYRRGHQVAEVEEVPTASVTPVDGLPLPTPVGDATVTSTLHRLTLRAHVGDVTVLVRAPTVDLLRDVAAALRRRGR